jgi:5-methyltetrahydrofolate--homocysteine methyltransferase
MMIDIPKQTGAHLIKGVPLSEIAPFIHWTFFFKAWKLSGKYDGIEAVCDCTSCTTGWLQRFRSNEQEEANEAVKLYKDAQEMLRRFRDENIISLNVSYGFYKAHSEEDDIVIHTDSGDIRIPVLRQQEPSRDGYCYALSDYIHPREDYIGVFANTVAGGEEFAAQFEAQDDLYTSILIKTLCDRLAEATAEWLHFKVRTEYWGYVPNESISIEDMFKVKYQGIRPAIGYPSLPDQSVIFELDPMLRFQETGITLTENGAMYPTASVCGLYFAHRQSKYFGIGKIDEEQFADYARRRGRTRDELRKWLAANL